MKKLLIALAAVSVGIAANAASYTWKCSSAFFDGTGTAGKMADGTTVYLMFESAYSQTDLVSDFATGGISTGKAIKSGELASSKLPDGLTATYDTTVAQTADLAIVYGGRLFVSTTANADYTAVGEAPISFANQAYLTRYNNSTGTLLPDNLASNGYAGAGWYNVPEPTSGLLLLLGMAGLALKRKRA